MASNNLETRIAKLESATRASGATEEPTYAIRDALLAQKGGKQVWRQIARALSGKTPQLAFGQLFVDDPTLENRLLEAGQAARVQNGGKVHA